MPDDAGADASREQRVDRVIAEYLAAVDAGRVPDPRPWLERHPELAPELGEFFADQDHLGLAARPTGRPDGGGAGCTETFAQETSDRPAPTSEGLCRSPEQGPMRGRFGNYELIETIGEGGQGIVLRARQHRPRRPVALKLIRSGRFASADALRRFRVEADTVAELDHPNIVPVYEVGEHGGWWFFSMRLMEGGSLAERLPRYVDDPRAAVRLIACVARAVQHAHGYGVLHRDLKPSNILFDAGDRPYVTDFGLAKREGSDGEWTQSGAIVGTPTFMAPEQAGGRREPVSATADVYGLGGILYALLTGRPPFAGGSALEVLEQVRSREPEPPGRSNRRVDRDLERICLKCLDKDPRRRYGTAEAVAEDLERWLAGLPVRARPTGAWGRSAKWARRRPAVAALLVAVVVLAASGFAGVTCWFWWQATLGQRELAWTAYLGQIAQAEMEVQRGDVARAVELLRRCDPALRGWEWYYLMGRRYREPRVLEHPGGSYDVAFGAHAGGQYLASAGVGGDVRVWDLSTGRDFTLRQEGEGAEVLAEARCVAFSPDGRKLAAGYSDGRIRSWSGPDFRPGAVREPHGDKRVISIAFAPDGRRLASAGADRSVRIADAETGEEWRRYDHGENVLSVAYSPDGRLIASASDDGEVQLRDAASGARVFDESLEGLRTDSARGVVFARGGGLLVVAYEDGSLRSWDTRTGRPAGEMDGHDDAARGVACSPDGARIASAGLDRLVRLRDTATGRETLVLRGHSGGVRAVAFGAGGRLIASAGDDGTVRLWEAPELETRWDATLSIRAHDGIVWSVAFDPHRPRVASAGGDRVVGLWETATGRPAVGRPIAGRSQIYGLAYSPDGRHLAACGAGGRLTLHDASSGRTIDSLDGRGEDLWAVAFSPPDGRLLAAADGGGHLRVWDLSTGLGGQPRDLDTGGGALFCLAFSTDGRLLATGGGAGRVLVWELGLSEPELLLDCAPAGAIYGVAFDHHRRRLAAAGAPDPARGEGPLRTWDVATWRLLPGPAGPPQRLDAVAYSPDGRHLVTPAADGTIRVWDAGTLREVRTLFGHSGRVTCVAFRPGGKLLASGGRDRVVRLWDATNWDALPRPMGPATRTPEALRR